VAPQIPFRQLSLKPTQFVGGRPALHRRRKDCHVGRGRRIRDDGVTVTSDGGKLPRRRKHHEGDRGGAITCLMPFSLGTNPSVLAQYTVSTL
jgi:hypothetical protein